MKLNSTFDVEIADYQAMALQLDGVNSFIYSQVIQEQIVYFAQSWVEIEGENEPNYSVSPEIWKIYDNIKWKLDLPESICRSYVGVSW